MNTANKNRNYGLDVLRSVAIILVFLSHYNLLTNQKLFGLLGQMGGLGVDLFFALSGYLIGNQIFVALKNGSFSLKTFYMRRFLRILPNYFFILSLYFLVPCIRERPLTISLWKFLTFTQNFYLIPGAFSHVWSLCIEEHFYLILPIVSLFFVSKRSLRWVGIVVVLILISEILIRSSIWLLYLRHAQENRGLLSMRLIYAPTFTRLDSLVLGVTLAILKIFHNEMWLRLIQKGNLFLALGVTGYYFVAYMFEETPSHEFYSMVLNYSVLALSSASLVLSALSKNSLLTQIQIPCAMSFATMSYAIYLTHKSLIHITQTLLSQLNIPSSNWIMLTVSVLLTLLGGLLLYIGIEKPFLKLRDRIGKTTKSLKAGSSIEKMTPT